MMDESTEYPAGAEKAAWEAVLASLCHLQRVLPDAVLGGGTAAALYAEHRFSFDHDHVVPDLRHRFDNILTELEAVAGWETARIKRPVVILGSLDGVETGVRQLRRAVPLETTVMQVGGVGVTLPTLPEVLRIKAFLCLDRNATRDYLDLAALAAHMGIESAVEALWRMDEYYPQRNDDQWAVRTQLIMQFAAPSPYDLDTVDLAEYMPNIKGFGRRSIIGAMWPMFAASYRTGFWTRVCRPYKLSPHQQPGRRKPQSTTGGLPGRRVKGKTIPPAKLPGA